MYRTAAYVLRISNMKLQKQNAKDLSEVANAQSLVGSKLLKLSVSRQNQAWPWSPAIGVVRHLFCDTKDCFIAQLLLNLKLYYMEMEQWQA